MIKKKINQGVAFGLLFSSLLTPTFALAKTTQEVIEDQPTSIYAPSSYNIEGINDDLLTPGSQNIPYQNYTQNNQNKENTKAPLVKGGNLKAVNPLATKENKARGTVLENVDKTGKDITPTGDIKKDKDNPVDVRQFLTFQTKSGKTMHLIVDHSAQQENVQLLTEVGEQDLLNMIEADEDAKPAIKEEPVKKEEPEEKTDDKEPKKEPKKEKSGSSMFIILVVIFVGAAAYYFKVVKNKDKKDMEDFEEENEDYIGESEEVIDNTHKDEEAENYSKDEDHEDHEDEDDDETLL